MYVYIKMRQKVVYLLKHLYHTNTRIGDKMYVNVCA